MNRKEMGFDLLVDIVNMIEESMQPKGVIKTCEEYHVDVDDFYDFLYDGEYEKWYYEKEERRKKNQSDAVNHPSHYNAGKFEVIDVIHDWKLGFSLGNAIKYIARAGKKDPKKYKEDLEKARWYIDDEIKRWEEDGKT